MIPASNRFAPLLCLTLVGLLLSVSACQQQTTSMPPPIPHDGSDCEPIPAWLESLPPWQNPTLRSTQLVTFHDGHNDALHILRYDIVLSRASLIMAAQTTMGVPLYESELRHGCLTVTRHMARLDAVPASQAVSDLVLVMWPAAALSSALAQAGYTLRLVESQRALIGPDGEPVLTANLQTSGTGENVHIRHHDMPLEVSIRILDQQADPP